MGLLRIHEQPYLAETKASSAKARGEKDAPIGASGEPEKPHRGDGIKPEIASKVGIVMRDGYSLGKLQCRTPISVKIRTVVSYRLPSLPFYIMLLTTPRICWP